MPNSKNPNLDISRDLPIHTGEEELWDLSDDWDDDVTAPPSTEDTSPTDEVIQPEIAEPVTPPTTIADARRSTEENEPGTMPGTMPATMPGTIEETANAPVPASSNPEESTQLEETSTETPEPEAPTLDQSASLTDPETSPKSGLSVIEKVTLSLVALSLLGLAIYSYIWLYEKNITTDEATVELPVTGEHTTISAFSTYWKTAGQNAEVKRGAHVLPAASITLDANSNSSDAALRIYFRNDKKNRVGDTITLAIKNGIFTPNTHPNIIIKDDGLTAEITSSDGFHQEGDFSAYTLDTSLAWTIFVLEAHSPSASGEAFKKVIKTTVRPKRK